MEWKNDETSIGAYGNFFSIVITPHKGKLHTIHVELDGSIKSLFSEGLEKAKIEGKNMLKKELTDVLNSLEHL